VTTSTTKITVEEVLSVWDFPRVEKSGSNRVLQTQTWKCGWCGSIFKGWNATKVLNHCTKTQGKTDIKACTGNIPREVMAALLAFKHTKTGLSTMKRLQSEAFTDVLSHNQMTMAVALEGSCSCSSNSCSVASHFDSAQATIAEYMYCTKELSLINCRESQRISRALRRRYVY
jgi:hypothetical protein